MDVRPPSRPCQLLTALRDDSLSRSASCPAIDRCPAADVIAAGGGIGGYVSPALVSPVSLQRLNVLTDVTSERPSSCRCTWHETESCRCSLLESDLDDVSNEPETRSDQHTCDVTAQHNTKTDVTDSVTPTDRRVTKHAAGGMTLASDAAAASQRRSSATRQGAPTFGVYNIGDIPSGLVTPSVRHDVVLQRTEQKRVRNKCLEWLDSLDNDDADVTTNAQA